MASSFKAFLALFLLCGNFTGYGSPRKLEDDLFAPPIPMPPTVTTAILSYLPPHLHEAMNTWLKKMGLKEALLSQIIQETADPHKKDLLFWVSQLLIECQQTYEALQVTELLVTLPKNERYAILGKARSFFKNDVPLSYKIFLLSWFKDIPESQRHDVCSWVSELLPDTSPITWTLQTFDTLKTISAPHAHMTLSSARRLFEPGMIAPFVKQAHKNEIIKTISEISLSEQDNVTQWASQVFPHNFNTGHQIEILKLLIKMTEEERQKIIPVVLAAPLRNGIPLHTFITTNYPNLSYTQKKTLNWPTPKQSPLRTQFNS